MFVYGAPVSIKLLDQELTQRFGGARVSSQNTEHLFVPTVSFLCARERSSRIKYLRASLLAPSRIFWSADESFAKAKG